MRRLVLATLATLSAAGFGAVVAASPASAATTTRLTLSVQAESGARRTVTLYCDPARGKHPLAAAACAELARAKGNAAAIPDGDGFCTMEYAPVTARLSGVYKGRTVKYKETFSNGCALGVGTGSVFRF